MTPYRFRPMSREDLGQVLEIERASFPTPWPASAYRYEIEHNNAATYVVMEPAQPPQDEAEILGYAGFWLIVDEAHISTIAISPRHRSRGLGLLLLLEVIRHATGLGAAMVTLEVRRSNLVAQALYWKCGFQQTGVRRAYYSDTREDALILATPPLSDPTYQARLDDLRVEIEARFTVRRPS